MNSSLPLEHKCFTGVKNKKTDIKSLDLDKSQSLNLKPQNKIKKHYIKHLRNISPKLALKQYNTCQNQSVCQ